MIGARAIVSRVRAYQIYKVVLGLRRKIRGWPRPALQQDNAIYFAAHMCNCVISCVPE